VSWRRGAEGDAPRSQYSRFILFNEGIAYMVMGSYEEAITSFKTYLAGYSDTVSSQLTLIICYVELGRNEEVRAEGAKVMRLIRDFLQCKSKKSSFKEPLHDRFFADYGKAGLK
jgi:tetratricopeptide (TPR) repeat protein